MERVDDLRWRKASFSGNGGASCVEVGQARDGMILVRDTKNRGRGPVHRCTPEEWRAFITGVGEGQRARGPAHRYTPEKWRAFIPGVRNDEPGLDAPGPLP